MTSTLILKKGNKDTVLQTALGAKKLRVKTVVLCTAKVMDINGRRISSLTLTSW